MFKGELGCAHAHYDEAIVLVVLVPTLHVGE
jgi:hypothetical protein